MRRTRLAAIAAACAATVLAVGGLAVGGAAAAAAPTHAAAAAAPAAVPAETSVTLPLFGAPLVVDITSAPGNALADVSINPSDGFSASKVKPNKVRFVNDAGTARVDIVSKHGGQAVSARAGQLADLSGPGGWSGDVFGTGTTTNVAFTIAALGDGSPDITGITVSDPAAVIGDVDHSSHDDRQSASVRIQFTNGTQARSLWISVKIGTHDGESRAKLEVGLSKLYGQSLPAEQVVGPQTWAGVLCDGTAATINYTVNADGSISDATATPATAQVKSGDRGLWVAFSDHERVSVRVKERGDNMKISVNERIRCDSADPTVNTPINEPAPGEGDGQHGSGDGSHHNGGNDDGSQGDGHHGGDGSNDGNGGWGGKNGG